jgi:hypothetical protein
MVDIHLYAPNKFIKKANQVGRPARTASTAGSRGRVAPLWGLGQSPNVPSEKLAAGGKIIVPLAPLVAAVASLSLFCLMQ